MSQQGAEVAIEAKRLELIALKRSLGDPVTKVKSAGSGGFVRRFAEGHIYWHANTGAHEVHGQVLERYLHLGGPGAHPKTGRRELGYPTSDEHAGHLGEPLSVFEFGRIHAVPGFRPAGAYGPTARGLQPDSLPVCEPLRSAAGEVLFTRRGCRYVHDGIPSAVLRATLDGPQLGHPALIRGDAHTALPVTVRWRMPQEDWTRFLAAHSGDAKRAVQVLAVLWSDRLALQSVAGAKIKRRVEVQTAGPAKLEIDGIPPRPEIEIRMRYRLAGDEPLRDRTLFDLVLQTSTTERYALASHAIYAQRDWRRFGFIHATDLHVTRRAETFRAKLREGGRPGGAREMVNPSDSLRATIRYANALHASGEIDFILATGDLVDYVFEGDDASDRRVSTNNFAHLHRILLGGAQPRDPAGDEGVELRVPIFTVLGNHDYVLNRTPLFFEVDLAILRDPKFLRWHGYNISKNETLILQDGHYPTVSEDAATNMLESGEHALPYYLSEINRARNYLVEIDGRHRIVMIDSGPNKDVIGSLGDALEEVFGFSNEDEQTFVRNLPNTVGRDDGTFAAAVKQPRSGAFIVGMHAPPLNPWGNDYSHYFRQTEHPHIREKRLGELTLSYLVRQTGSLAGAAQHRDWLTGNTRHFKRGDISDLLDFGIAKLQTASPDEFIKQLVRGDVDMVLCGHVHERVEFRVRLDSDGRPLVYTDFYTENLSSFRESRDEHDDLITLRVKQNAAIGEEPSEVTDSRGMPQNAPKGTVRRYRALDVPPYPNPLSDAPDKARWWSDHRPLILQTACVGPADYVTRFTVDESVKPPLAIKRRNSYQGVRLVRIVGDHIASVAHVGMEEIRRVGSAMPKGPPTHEDPTDPKPKGSKRFVSAEAEAAPTRTSSSG